MVGKGREARFLVSRSGRCVARTERRYTLAELLVVLAVIGIMAFIAVPSLLTYTSGATIDYGARELRSGLTRAKLMAVTTRQPVCVQPTAGGYQFFQKTTCNGTPWADRKRGVEGKRGDLGGRRNIKKKKKKEREKELQYKNKIKDDTMTDVS